MSVEPWHVGFLASLLITVFFGAIGLRLLVDLNETDQWRNNPLALATVFLYLSCAGSHGVRTVQLFEPVLGITSLAALASHVEYSWTHMILLDIVTASAGAWYWTMRRRYPSLVRGTAIFEDLRIRQREALSVHDGIVQGLSEAKLAIEAGEHERGEEAIDETMASAKELITELMDAREDAGGQGTLRREEL